MVTDKQIEEAAKKLINIHYGAYYNDLSGFDAIQTQMYNDGFKDATKWAIEEFLKGLWHDASEEPRKGANCILYVSYEFEQNPEDNYHEYTTAVYLGGGFSEDHFESEADVYTIKWAYLSDILPKEGGEE